MENRQKSIKLNFVMNAALTMSSIIFPIITFPYVSRILMLFWNRASDICYILDILL